MVAGRQVLPLRRSTQLVKVTSEHSFGPSRNHHQPPQCSKHAGERKGSVQVLHIPWPVGPELCGQDLWWDLGYRTGAALGVHVAEITRSWTRSRG